MRHPRYRRRNRARANFSRPRFDRIRAVLVELVLLAILIDPRNVVGAAGWHLAPTPGGTSLGAFAVAAPNATRWGRAPPQGQQPLNQHLRLHHYMCRAVAPGLLQRVRNPPSGRGGTMSCTAGCGRGSGGGGGSLATQGDPNFKQKIAG